MIDLRTGAERKRGVSDFAVHGLRAVHELLLASFGAHLGISPPQLAQRILGGEFDWLALYHASHHLD